MSALQPLSRVLLVEDDPGHAELARRAFERAPELALEVAGSLGEARAALGAAAPHLVIADLKLPDGRGIELLPEDPEAARWPVLIMTSHGDEAIAVEAMKAGALDYLVKTAESLGDLPRVASRALREWNLVLERRRVREELTERERQLAHAQRLEAIGRLASGVAHDFNNLLMGLSGCAELALSELGAGAPARRYVEEIQRAAQGGAGIAKSLLTFGRRGGGEIVSLEVDGAVAATRQLLSTALGDSVALKLELGAGETKTRCGTGEVEQVLLNLAINARDAMPRGGTLTISTRVDALPQGNAQGLPPGRYVVLTVADTGTGMDEATLARAFEPFFTTKAAGKGTGLGLAMVHGLARNWGGQVAVESALGKGTRFTLHFPEALEAPALVAISRRLEAEPTPQPKAKTCVLLVEDDPRVRMLTRRYLELEGHAVLEAGEVAAARRLFGAEVGLLLTDVALPDGDGPSLAWELRERAPHLPVVFMSAHAAMELQESLHFPPDAPLLTKPFSRPELSATLRTALSARAKPAVLLVEDNRTARLATSELLADEGFQVFAAASAEEAMRVWGEHRGAIGAVITDLSLPGTSGDQLVKALRADRPSLPVLYVSGRSSSDPEVRQLVQRPASRFLSKPVDVARLAEELRSLVGLPRA